MEIAVQEKTNTLPALITQPPVEQIELKPLNLIDRIIDAINKKQNYLSYHLMRKLTIEEFKTCRIYRFISSPATMPGK